MSLSQISYLLLRTRRALPVDSLQIKDEQLKNRQILTAEKEAQPKFIQYSKQLPSWSSVASTSPVQMQGVNQSNALIRCLKDSNGKPLLVVKYSIHQGEALREEIYTSNGKDLIEVRTKLPDGNIMLYKGSGRKEKTKDFRYPEIVSMFNLQVLQENNQDALSNSLRQNASPQTVRIDTKTKEKLRFDLKNWHLWAGYTSLVLSASTGLVHLVFQQRHASMPNTEQITMIERPYLQKVLTEKTPKDLKGKDDFRFKSISSKNL